MATYVENLIAIRDNYVQQLLELSTSATRKLSYSIDGQSVDWTAYQKWLSDNIDLYNARIQAARPFVVVSKGRS